MMNQRSRLPTWIPLLAAAVIAGELGVLGLVLAGMLRGPGRNLLPQALVGGAVVLAALAGYLLRRHGEQLPAVPARLGLAFLSLVSFALVGVYFFSVRALLALPYDLGSWSEPMMIVDIIKLRAGALLYLPPDDSNSNTYTFLAPVMTYFLAWASGHSASIPAYRVIQQVYLALAALLAGSSAFDLFALAAPEKSKVLGRVWLLFFVPASFLFATNNQTNVFNVYLHNDPLALLLSTLAFWLMIKHATSGNDRLLLAMAAMPALCFLSKQYLAVWAAVYSVYLWLDGRYTLGRVIVFAAASFGLVALTIGACMAVWGQPFRYWVFQVMGSHVVSFTRMGGRFADAGWYIALGLVGGLVLARGENLQRLLGILAGWLFLLFGALYTSGITFHPSHLGPLTMVSVCFFLAAVAKLWPVAEEAPTSRRAEGWAQVVLSCGVILAVFAGLGFTLGRPHPVTPDLFRYAHAIEREFEGQTPERVLLDIGDWVYLPGNVVMKDRSSIFVTHRTPEHWKLIDRIRERAYARILLHVLPDGRFSYDIGPGRGIGKVVEQNYREVRRIPPAAGMEGWLYYNNMMTEVVVFEPIPEG